MKDNNDKFLIYTKIKAKGLKNLWKEKLLEKYIGKRAYFIKKLFFQNSALLCFVRDPLQ